MNGALQRSKRQWRREMKQLRQGIPAAQRAVWSETITRQLLADSRFQQASAVMAFASMRTEVDTWRLLQLILDQGKTLVLPRCLAQGSSFEPAIVADLTRDLVAADLPDLKDPAAHRPCWPESAVLPVVLVPGLAFDARGYRLGYGGGMYDRFLARYRVKHTLGLAFDVQRVAALPTDQYDIALDQVLTEKGWF